MMDMSLGSIKTLLVNFLHRYHTIVFTVVVLGGLAIAVLILNGTVNESSNSNGYVSTGNSITFDKATIDRINNLKSPDQASQISLPDGRTNPFVE
jgi:hypothetical protein